MNSKKKRGCNYTATEKEILLYLIKKNLHVIENKETSANMILKKREAWNLLCQQYNAVAVSGKRKWQQLRHLYENLKQKSKKDVSKINREKYGITKELKKKASINKEEMDHTGSGACKSTLPKEDDSHFLTIEAPPIQPLPNPYEDARIYLGDEEVVKNNEDDESDMKLITINKIDNQNTSTHNVEEAENIELCPDIPGLVNTDDQNPTKATLYREGKKRRGCNYTAAEKEMLLDLIKQHQHVIENKETNARMILKKREAWDLVCQQYNAVAVSGKRKWQQLRHLYENLKQRSKKNIAKRNREKCNENIKELQKRALSVKVESSPTADGASSGDVGVFKRNEDDKSELLETTTDKIDEQDIRTSNMSDNSEPFMDTLSTVNTDDQELTGTVCQNCNKSQSSTSEMSGETINKSNTKQEQTKANYLKSQYFNAKLRNAKLENKYLINKNRMNIAKHKIEMEILKITLEKLKNTRK